MSQIAYSNNTARSDTSRYNALRYMIENAKKLMSTATIVKVKKVSSTGEVAAVGTVDVQPLVKLVDGIEQATSHGVVHGLPYFRLQGGSSKAVIMDPKVGDLGLVVFADRDVSNVKKTKKEATPGSHRRFDMQDGIYLGALLADAPTCYIRFTDDDKIIMSPDNGVTVVTIEANKIKAETPAGGSALMAVVTDDHAAIKYKGDSSMHLTINKNTGEIQAGKSLTITSDPFTSD